MTKQLRDLAAAAVIALAITTCGFVAVRNHELAERQRALATNAAHQVATGHVAPLGVTAVVVRELAPSPRHHLAQRAVFDNGDWRPLTGRAPATSDASSDDKLIYDAAARYARDSAAGRHATPVTELLADGRAIAVRPLDGPEHGRLAIAVTPPGTPLAFPWLVVTGVFGLAVVLAAAGVYLARYRALALTLAIACLAIPSLLLGAPIATAAIATLAVAVGWAQQRAVTDAIAAAVKHHRVALGFVAPAAVAMAILVIVPFVIGLAIGFYDHHNGEWTFVGIDNFREILSGGGRALDDPLNFWFVLGVTVLWTFVNVALHVALGVALALALSRSWLRGRTWFRLVFILPWAVPNYITAMIFRGMFATEHGAINSLLDYAGVSDVSWFSSWATSFSANVITNTWLGFPFMMVVALGALQTIPKELYEAAAVDGATPWQQFRHITLPHLRPALGPAVTLGSIWTFNMFNIIFLVSRGEPGGATNILVTDAYRWAFERGERYGMAAAYGALIFVVLLLWLVFGARIARVAEKNK